MNDESPILKAIYSYIDAYIREHGYGPSVRNIAESCHIAVATAAYNLDKLEAEGRITREMGLARSLRVAEPNEKKF